MHLKSQNCTANDPGFLMSSVFSTHNIPEAWDITCGDPEIVVAVVDVFSSQFHEDLQGKIENIVEIDPLSPQFHECSHGNSTAGMVAAIPDNGIAIAGAGYNTRVAAYNVANSCTGSGPRPGFYEAVANNEDIINMSWTAGLGGNDVANVQNYVDDGGVLVTSAFSNGWSQVAPIDGVINVGRMAWDGSVNSFVHFQYGDNGPDNNIDIYVSGFNLYTLKAFDQWGIAGGDPGTNNGAGTSSLAPIVAGIVGLIKSVNSNLSAAEIECIIKLSARGQVLNAPANSYAKYLDAEAAVLMAQNWPNNGLGEETILTGTQNLTNITATGHVLVKTGADITVTGSVNLGHEESKIFIERGARLIIDGAVVAPVSCIDSWRGFVVEGNANKSQPSNVEGPLENDDAGVLLLRNQAVVNNARNAVSMHNTHKSSILDYTGGVVIAQNTTFNDNGRSFEFMKYDLGDKSLIANCTFNNNDRHVITAWRSSGIGIHSNNFNGYEKDCIFTATSAFESTWNNFVGTGVVGGFDTENLYGVVINNATSINQNYFIDNCTFTRNTFAIRIEGTDNNNPNDDGSIFSNITSIDDDFGIYSQGSDKFHIRDSEFSNQATSIFIYNSGTAENKIYENQIGALIGLSIVNQNDLLTFFRNCFDWMPNNSSVDDIEIVGTPTATVSVNPEQFLEDGTKNLSPDNCFQELSRDIVQSNNSNISNLFTYGRDQSLPNSDCRVPLINNLFTYSTESMESVVPGCGPNNGDNPINLVPYYCSGSSTSLHDLNQDRINLQNDIDNLEALPHLNFAQLHLLRKLKRCLGKLEVNIAKILINQNEFDDLRSSFKDADLEFTKVGIVSLLINNGKYSEAKHFMDAVTDIRLEWNEYAYAQNILIDFLSDFENYDLTVSDESILINTGKKSNYYAAYIRGVYAEIKQESILVDFASSRQNNPRNVDDEVEISDIIISPNPSVDIIEISSNSSPIKSVSIISYTGQVVYTNDSINSNKHKINLSDMQSGILFVSSRLQNGEVITKKIIKL